MIVVIYFRENMNLKVLTEPIQIKDAKCFVGEIGEMTYLCFETEIGLIRQNHAVDLTPEEITHYVNKHKQEDVNFFKTSFISDYNSVAQSMRERMQLMYSIECEQYGYPEMLANEIEDVLYQHLKGWIDEEQRIEKLVLLGDNYGLLSNEDEGKKYVEFYQAIEEIYDKALETLVKEDQ